MVPRRARAGRPRRATRRRAALRQAGRGAGARDAVPAAHARRAPAAARGAQAQPRGRTAAAKLRVLRRRGRRLAGRVLRGLRPRVPAPRASRAGRHRHPRRAHRQRAGHRDAARRRALGAAPRPAPARARRLDPQQARPPALPPPRLRRGGPPPRHLGDRRALRRRHHHVQAAAREARPALAEGHAVTGPELERLIQLLARLPGLGPRSARRAALALMKKRDQLLTPLAEAMREAAEKVVSCSVCGNLDTVDPCAICADAERDAGTIVVGEDVGDLWALERAGAVKGRYHVLGGVLSALDGIGPEDLSVAALVRRVEAGGVGEVILAMNATVEGQTTAHYVADRLAGLGATVTRLAHGVPVGGELDYLDDGTLVAALKSRRQA